MRVDDYDSLILFVGDLSKAKAFYVDILGLPVRLEDENPRRHRWALGTDRAAPKRSGSRRQRHFSCGDDSRGSVSALQGRGPGQVGRRGQEIWHSGPLAHARGHMGAIRRGGRSRWSTRCSRQNEHTLNLEPVPLKCRSGRRRRHSTWLASWPPPTSVRCPRMTAISLRQRVVKATPNRQRKRHGVSSTLARRVQNIPVLPRYSGRTLWRRRPVGCTSAEPSDCIMLVGVTAQP